VPLIIFLVKENYQFFLLWSFGVGIILFLENTKTGKKIRDFIF